MAAEILERWAPILVVVELVTASKGAFRVMADGRSVFDKADQRRFPEPGELTKALEPDFGPPLAWRQAT